MIRIWSVWLTTLALCTALLLASIPVLAATVEAPVVPEPDAAEDREPAIIAQRIGTTDYVIAAWMKGRENPQIRVASSQVQESQFGGWTLRTLCAFADSSCISGDPYLAENSYAAGIAPRRVYLAGTSYKKIDGVFGKNQISVWPSDDGGESWDEPIPLSYWPNGNWFADKPSIAVSWQPGTIGRVYVAHMHFNNGTFACGQGSNTYKCPSRILVYRSDEEGNFLKDPNITGDKLNPPPTSVLTDIGNPQSPIIMVHPSNMDWVYLAWLDWETDSIYVAFSMDGGRSFPVIKSKTVGNLLKVNHDDHISNGEGASIYATSLLMARFNSEAGKIGLVWHERELGSHDFTDVKFISWDPVSYTFGMLWTVTGSQSISEPGASTDGNQWNPAIDYDADGNYLVTYYDTRDTTQGATEFNYVVRAAQLYADGFRMQPPVSDTKLTPQQSDLMRYAHGYRRVGEYQDVWNWFGTWYAAFIQISSSGEGDAAVVRITDEPPTASFTHSCNGHTCTFNASGSTDDRGIVSRTWTFGDATSDSGQVVSHTYATSGTFTVELKVTDTVGQTAQQSQEVTVGLQPPTNVLATANGSSVLIEWNPSATAQAYHLERKVTGQAWAWVASTAVSSSPPTTLTDSAPPITDDGVAVYRVRASKGGLYSAYSSLDFAHPKAFTDPNLTNVTTVKAAHIIELRKAVNAIADAAGISAPYLPADLLESSLKTPGRNVQAADFTDLLSRVNVLREHAAYGQAKSTFSITPTSNTLIYASQITDLRNAVQ